MRKATPLCLGCFGLMLFSVSAQINFIAPTVRAKMGDVGGRLFGQAPNVVRTRHYYVAAEDCQWDFMPQSRDVVCGSPIPSQIQTNHFSPKIRYVAYTDESFTRRASQNPNLGILGPVLRGVVGEYIVVTFWNRSHIILSMHPHGVKYDKDNEGSYYQPHPGLGAAIAPNAKFTYVWQLDESSGPLPNEPSSKAWLYHSHVTGDAEINMGLVGFIIVTDPQRARPDGTPNDVDRELASLFMIFNENGKPDLDDARPATGTSAVNLQSQSRDLTEQGERYTINGRIFGNLTGLEMNEGERVRWYLFGLGSESDLHSAHWHGLRVTESGRHTDVVELLPASMKTADMIADNPGSWLFHCHVAEHMTGGMFARVTVYPTEGSSTNHSLLPAFFGNPAANTSH